MTITGEERETPETFCEACYDLHRRRGETWIRRRERLLRLAMRLAMTITGEERELLTSTL